MLNVFDSTASKVLLGLAIILIAGFQYLYWFGEGGYHDHQQLTQKIQQQMELNDEMKERNRVLAAEVYDLKNGIEAIEEQAEYQGIRLLCSCSTNFRNIRWSPEEFYGV